MHRKLISLLALLLVLGLMAGCNGHTSAGSQDTTPATEQPVATESPAVTEPPTEAVTIPDPTAAETTAPEVIIAYQITVRSPKLAIHSGPGYSYDIVDHITDRGDYVIIAHEFETLGNNQQTIWGRLQSEKGWINLDDAFAEGFEPYLFKIQNPWLEIYSGPGYDYDPVRSLKDRGTYTIVEESIQYFTGGRYVTWGKLKSGVGWICLDDAKLTTDLGPPYRCTECGRADISISRYGLCDSCYTKSNPAPYGTCAVCGDALSSTEYNNNDGFVCFNCLVCGWCGDPITIMDVAAFSTYMCPSCYEKEYCCSICRADCFSSGTQDGMCTDCYRDTYFPEDPYSNCGVDCSYRGSIDGLCYDCYEAACTMISCPYCGSEFSSANTDEEDICCPDCGESFSIE